MNEIGLRELRLNAADLVRRAQAGERMTITVAGRPAAVLGPAESRTWQRWEQFAHLFDQPAAPGRSQDRGILDEL